MSKDFAYVDEFCRAKEILYSVSDCRGLKIEGIEQDEDSVAEIDSVDALLEFLSGLEWEYNIQIEEREESVLVWNQYWVPKEVAEKGIGKLRKELKGKIVKRVKAGKVQDA